MDGLIILWHTILVDSEKEQKYKRTYDYHRGGVVSLAFNEALILLLSAGIDHNINVFNPYIGSSIF